jgi:hypothetical protein
MITLQDRRYAASRARVSPAVALTGLAPLLALALACFDGALLAAAGQLLSTLAGGR